MPVIDYGRLAGSLFVVTPPAPGIPLMQHVHQQDPSVPLGLQLGIQVAGALAELHAAGGLHRNVESTNVLLTKTAEAPFLLVGFGSLRRFHQTRLVGQDVGRTIMYMSPEETGTIDCPVGPSSDLYSLGIVLFETITGRTPFAVGSASQVLRDHLTAEVPDIRRFDPTAPRELNEVIQRLLRKDPLDRYQSAEALVDDLTQIARRMSDNAESEQPAFTIGCTDIRSSLTESGFVSRVDELSQRLRRRWAIPAEAGGRPTLVVASFVTTMVEAEHTLRQLVPTHHLRIMPLSDLETRAMLQSMAGKLPEEVLHVSQGLAAGSPFMATAAIRGLVEAQALIADKSGWTVDSRAMADIQSSRAAACILARRIELLPPATVQVLAIGASLARDSDPAIIAHIPQIELATVERAMRQALERHLIWSGTTGNAFKFV